MKWNLLTQNGLLFANKTAQILIVVDFENVHKTPLFHQSGL